MKVYFVRHGQSIFNKEERHQFPDTPLSDEGLKQAEAIGNRFNNILLDLILSSPYKRALQTAQKIQKVTHAPLTQVDLFKERKHPSIYWDKLHRDPEIQLIHAQIREHIHDPGWHYADEENFTDLLLRSKEALNFIASQKKENVAVVTHGYFLSFMIHFMLYEKNLTPELFKSFREHSTYSNTGLTMCEFTDDKWRLLTWNDYAHLGE